MYKCKNNVGADASTAYNYCNKIEDFDNNLSVRPTSKARQNKGITLIALVITIIVMLILVAVTISMAVNGGLFDYAGKATGETQNAIDKEQDLASGKVTIGEITYNSIDEYLNTEEKEFISTTEPYVGYYADVDGDGTVDGVIYADLAIGNTGDGEYTNSYGTYTINKIEGVKNYYVSQTNYEGTFGIKDVLTGYGTGNDRFYVMALSNIHWTTCWYASAYGKVSDYDTVTSGDFGTGKKNTETMIELWNDDVYGQKDTGSAKDIWGLIQTHVENGWFVPSRGEWSAFGEEIGITTSNNEDYGVYNFFQSSTLRNESEAWHASLYDGDIYYADLNRIGNYCVRLSTTF